MKVGIPKEIKNREYRIGITPAGVHALVQDGHTVFVEKDGGLGSMITNEEYMAAGAKMVSAKECWNADMIVKVKEPLPEEYKYFQAGQVIFTYLHLAAEKGLTDAMMKAKVTGIAYETVQMPDRSLPLLAPMSEIAGRMATQVAANLLTKKEGGMGILLGGTAGVQAGHVVIVGAGTVGLSAAKVAMGMGARVTIFDNCLPRLRQIDDLFGGRIQTLASNAFNLAKEVKEADVVIGSVLVPGAITPQLVTKAMVDTMKPGSVIVDVAIDQGGAVEVTAKHGATSHDDPTFIYKGVVCYCVGNMPGAVARTSTFTLTNATMPYMVALAKKGWKQACKDDISLNRGINVHDGKLYFKGVTDAFGYPLHSTDEILK